eukprot:GEMP01034841.1.p1 GENE.GEMP01034841.1~~GEMP01034841.1.p1  ORF type:complete len:274 (+),score=25.21 GEMP01034841.1:274-1095(+)
MSVFQYSTDNLKSPDPTVIYRAASWNSMRCISDVAHLLALATLVLLIVILRAVPSGLSFKSRTLYLAVFLLRYVDIFNGKHTSYLLFFKFFYILASAFIVLMFVISRPRYLDKRDPLNATVLCICSFLATVFLSYEMTAAAYLWTFSQCLESCVMLPQYVAHYSNKRKFSSGTMLYVVLIALYRVTAALSWLWKKWLYGAIYQDFPFFIFDLPVTIEFFAHVIFHCPARILALLASEESSGQEARYTRVGYPGEWNELGTTRRRQVDDRDDEV